MRRALGSAVCVSEMGIRILCYRVFIFPWDGSILHCSYPVPEDIV